LADESEDAESLEAIHGKEAPARYVQRVTQLKLQAAIERAVHRHLWNAEDAPPILCADTTVAMGRMILGKPDGISTAGQILKALSGKSHRVLTSVGVAWRVGQQVKTGFALSESRVTFACLSNTELRASNQPCF
jgi:septum formation protein